jgi:hypothetical protein
MNKRKKRGQIAIAAVVCFSFLSACSKGPQAIPSTTVRVEPTLVTTSTIPPCTLEYPKYEIPTYRKLAIYGQNYVPSSENMSERKMGLFGRIALVMPDDENIDYSNFFAYMYESCEARSADTYGESGVLVHISALKSIGSQFIVGDEFICDCVADIQVYGARYVADGPSRISLGAEFAFVEMPAMMAKRLELSLPDKQ